MLPPRVRLLAILAPIMLLASRSALAQDLAGPETRKVFDRYCIDCHDADVKKGNLDLTALGGDLSSRERLERWVRLFGRLERGEMPPAGKSRPSAAELRALLARMKPVLARADRAYREVVQRRLNRVEYQNTVTDLLSIDIDLKRFLPEDQEGGGFDTNGEALALSTDQMERYLEAAELAIDTVLVRGPRPKVETVTADSLHEVKRYMPRQYSLVDNRVVVYMSNKTQYSKISTRAKRLPRRGRYRFTFEAAAHQSKTPLIFSVVASDFDPISAVYTNLGYYPAGPEPKTFTIEATLDKRFAIQFFAMGLPEWVNNPGEGGNHPGIGFGPVKITGPLNESWPPEGHARIVGEVDLDKGTAKEAEGILHGFLPRAFRRPVTKEEVARYVGLVDDRMKAGRGFREALRTALVAVLCSPNFLYLEEEAQATSTRISDSEFAARLSAFLWSSMPDGALTRRAAEGALRRPATLRAEVDRMLRDPKGERFVTRFVGQWLDLDDIEETTPDRKLYPEFDEFLQVSMVREGEAFFREVLEKDLPASTFLDSDFAMLNARLARHYGIKNVHGAELKRVALPPGSLRGGVLTQAGVLKVTANGTTTSPVLRGVWVLENILGRTMPPPPPNVPGIEPDIRGAETIREQLAKHRNIRSCNACHQHIDPPGFALEAFDPVGKHRTKYLRWIPHPQHADKGWGHVAPGADVDASGKFPTGEPFAGLAEFRKHLLLKKDAFVRCLIEKLMAYGLGREIGFSDRGAVEAVVKRTAARGHGLRSLIQAIVGHEIFATR